MAHSVKLQKYLGGDYVPAKQDLKLPTAKS